ncbi:phosphate ABC transporter substrate-binding protein [Aureivirga sp. CE67]|uniref:phosphate ABC transporter substrate-binding protein n=1 Tax=Aureivirga sp. CE67 TaxID=1788983 RepID=UPI0018CA6597|nr:phosphate ABC transporter substrate-binding protein [Aureivirga sp. CE67]
MKISKKLKNAFGLNEYQMIDFPRKISSVKIARILHHEEMGGCSFCFPHGFETINSKESKFQKNWKKYRKNQWK